MAADVVVIGGTSGLGCGLAATYHVNGVNLDVDGGWMML